MKVEDRIKQAFDPYFDAPIEAWKSFANLGEVIPIEKGRTLKKSEDSESFLRFILHGSGGILLWNNNNYVCIDLCYEGEFFGDYISLLNQVRTPLEVKTFETCELFQISRMEFHKIRNEHDIGRKICQFAAEALFIEKQNQQIDMLTKSAKQRYVELLTKQPEIVLRTPQKYVASYLGVTPQSLSRIRKELASGD